MTEIYEVIDTSDDYNPIPCAHCGDDIRTEVVSEGSLADTLRRWSHHLDVTCHCGAVNVFYTHWTPYTVRMWELHVTYEDDPREEALTASERNPTLR